MANTTYGDISQRTAAYAASEMLSHAEPVLILQKFGLTKPMPKKNSLSINFQILDLQKIFHKPDLAQ